MAANTFARDREAGTLDILLTTRLKGHSFVLGTFFGLIRSALPFVGILFLVLLIGVVSSDKIVLLWSAINTAVYFTFTIVVGMYMSLVCKNATRAVGWTLAVLLFLGVGIPVIGGIVEETSRTNDIGEFVFACSPDYWIARGPEKNPYRYSSDFGGYVSYIVVTIAYIAVTYVLMRVMIARFDRHVKRQPSSWSFRTGFRMQREDAF